MKSSIAISCFLLLFSFSLFSKPYYEFNTNCRHAYYSIINLRFDEGKVLINKEKQINPDNCIVYLLENYVDFLTLVIGENKNDFERLKPNKSLRIDKLEDNLCNSPYYLYSLAEINIQWAISRVKFKEYFQAAVELNKAFKLLEKNQKLYPDFILNKKGLGIIHVLIGVVPDEYKWVTKLFAMKGSVKQGLDELEQFGVYVNTYPDNNLFKTESYYFLTMSYLNFINDKKKLQKLYNQLQQENLFDDAESLSPLMIYCKANIALSTGRSKEAIETLKQYKPTPASYPFLYLDYLYGIALLNGLNPEAEQHFINYITSFCGQSYLHSAYQRLAWCSLLKNDIRAYQQYVQQSVRRGYKHKDEINQTKKETEISKVPDIRLLKARLLCDGGYYEQAIKVLIDINITKFPLSSGNNLEYTYRLARIYDEWGKDTDAIAYYELTIKQGSSSKLYFAANACLQLGIIYENRGDCQKAAIYYNKCLSLDFDEYHNSIRFKAKIALKRLSV